MPIGRPTKLNATLQASIVEYLKQGVPQETAARMSGLSPAALFEWKVRGEKAAEAALAQAGPDADHTAVLQAIPEQDRPFVDFLEAVETARAEAEGSYALVVRRAAVGGDVRAAMWWLDRAYPERWAQRTNVAVTQEGKVRVVIEGW